METFSITMKDGTKITYEGKDLRDHWHKLCNDPNAAYGDYYRPGKIKPKLFAYFGGIETTLPL